MDDKQPVPANGDGQEMAADGVNSGGGASGAGESGGGARAGAKDPGGKIGGFLGHGGQSEIAYHGPGQLGTETVDDRDAPNSATGQA